MKLNYAKQQILESGSVKKQAILLQCAEQHRYATATDVIFIKYRFKITSYSLDLNLYVDKSWFISCKPVKFSNTPVRN